VVGGFAIRAGINIRERLDFGPLRSVDIALNCVNAGGLTAILQALFRDQQSLPNSSGR